METKVLLHFQKIVLGPHRFLCYELIGISQGVSTDLVGPKYGIN